MPKAKTITLRFTKLQTRMIREWAVTGRQADLEAFDEGLVPYGITKEKCKQIWIDIFKEFARGNKAKV